VLRTHRPEAEEHHLRLDVELGPAGGPAMISGDRRLLARLISNLVQNAIRHNFPDGEVDVRVSARAGTATLTVSNTGPVVPAGEIERLLQPFQRLATDRLSHRDGFGLGLSIVAAIAAAHDARLGIAPGKRGGLNVEVAFPLAAGVAPAREPQPDPGAPVRTAIA
jgi:signal transduction histidine kinase